MESLEDIVYRYAQRLKSLEDFISFQFGDAYQQFCHQKSEVGDPEDNLINWRKVKKASILNEELEHPASAVENDDEDLNYYSQQSSSNSSNEKRDSISQQLGCFVPDSLEVDFVTDPSSEVDPLDIKDDNFWEEENEDEDTELPVVKDEKISNSAIYDIYDDEEDEESNDTDIKPQTTETRSFIHNFQRTPIGFGRNTHQPIIMQSQSHECAFCVHKFPSRNGMFQHILDVHTGGENYCPLCHKGYTYQKDFRCHLSRHDKRNKIRFKCSYCVKYFGSRKELNNHERIHTGEKPYACATCQRVFRTSSSVIRHQKCHGSFVCQFPDCKIRFLSYKDLVQHQTNSNHRDGKQELGTDTITLRENQTIYCVREKN